MVRIHFKTILTIIAAICISSVTQAQLSAGGRIGLNLGNLHGSSVNNNSMLVGYNIGGFANYKMTEFLSGDLADIMSLQGEFTFQSKGTNADFVFTDGTKKVKQVLTYIQIPVLAKFTFPTNGELKYYGEGGLYLSSLFGLTIDGEKSYDVIGVNGTSKRKYREEYSGFGFGVTLGGGVSMPFGGKNSPWEAFAGLRYSLGLKNIAQVKDKTPDWIKPNFENIKTNALSILAGVTYAF